MTPEQIQTHRQPRKDHYVSYRLDKAVEAFAALIVCIQQTKRQRFVEEEFGILRPSQTSSIEEALAYNALCQNVAKAKLMLSDIELMLDDETLTLTLEREMDRVKKEENV